MDLIGELWKKYMLLLTATDYLLEVIVPPEWREIFLKPWLELPGPPRLPERSTAPSTHPTIPLAVDPG
jgi:hypothetical protein